MCATSSRAHSCRAPIIAVSSVTGEGIDKVRTVLDEKIRATTFHEEHGRSGCGGPGLQHEGLRHRDHGSP